MLPLKCMQRNPPKPTAGIIHRDPPLVYSSSLLLTFKLAVKLIILLPQRLNRLRLLCLVQTCFFSIITGAHPTPLFLHPSTSSPATNFSLWHFVLISSKPCLSHPRVCKNLWDIVHHQFLFVWSLNHTSARLNPNPSDLFWLTAVPRHSFSSKIWGRSRYHY